MNSGTRTFRPKPHLPKGLRDESGAHIFGQRRMMETIQMVYERYGFELLDTPAFEYADAIGKFLPDDDRPNEGVFSFQDDNGQWLSLRYDLTAPLARYVAANYDSLPKPFRRYQWGHVWRNEKPGPGRYRQFLQVDADTVGASSMAADAELIAMMAECMDELGIPRDNYVIRVNNRKVLDGVLETIGVSTGDAKYDVQRRTILRAIDKLDRLGLDDVEQLLGEGRRDKSGDFTKGAGLKSRQIQSVMAFVAAASGGGSRNDVCNRLRETAGNSEVGNAGVDQLEEIDRLLVAEDLSVDRVIFDPSVVRGLDYYTGPVFEIALTFEVNGQNGNGVRLGSVGSGGRYDDLVKMFKGVEVPATGCSFGVSRLYAALQQLGAVSEQSAFGPVVVLVLDRERLTDYQAMARELRRAGVRAEMYLGTSGMRAQLKYADKRHAPVAVIEGEDERAQGRITLKDLVLGAEKSSEIEDNMEWRKSEAVQISVPRDKLVDGVKDILSRYAGSGI